MDKKEMSENKFAKWTDGMLDIALAQNQKQIKEHHRFIEMYEKDTDEIQDEIKRRLAANINNTISKLKESEDSFV